MSQFFQFIRDGIDVGPIKAELEAHPELWGRRKARLFPGSPHAETTDIWARFRNPDDYVAQYGGDMSHFVDQHQSEWLHPEVDCLPAIRFLARQIAGDRALGGVLLTKTLPGGRILPHVDRGWHAEVHDKFYLAIQVAPGMEFGWEDGVISARDGEVWSFRNDAPHWVNNPTPIPRIGAIFCLRKAGT